MNDPLYQELIETIWRRELTPEELARLRAHLAKDPEKQAELEVELALSRSLRKLPQPVPASNFSAQVLRAVKAEETRQSRPHASSSWGAWWRLLWPKTAWAAAVVVLGAVGFQQYRVHERGQLAMDLAQIPVTEKLPAPEVFQDFDAIRQLSQVSTAGTPAQAITDDALLAALQ